jgi:DNA-binding XRE family transcriptional regulator
MNAYKQLRLTAKISRRDAAELLEISWNHLRNIECNQGNPSIDVFLRMIITYNSTTEQLTNLFNNVKDLRNSNTR